MVLIYIFLTAIDDEHPFICLWALRMSSLEKCLFRSFASFLIGLFVFLEWSCVSSLCILEIKSLSEVSLAKTFSHKVCSLFILLFSLAIQKLFILMKSHLFILSFMFLALGDISVKILLLGMSEIFCLCSPLGLLWCHNLYLSLLSTLSLFFCIWYKLVVKFQFFACTSPDHPTPFVEEAIFIPFYAPAPFIKY